MPLVRKNPKAKHVWVDTRCFDLAEHFLYEHRSKPEYKALCDQLAQCIQTAVEGWCEDNEPDRT